MVHAQLVCQTFKLDAHTVVPPGSNNAETALALRNALIPENANDAAMARAAFGIGSSGDPALLADVAARTRDVQRRVIKRCSLQWDSERDGVLYDPSFAGIAATATINRDGILSARLTGAGAHFISTVTNDSLTREERIAAAVAKTRRQYCAPTATAPAGHSVAPYTKDEKDRLYIVDNHHVEVPVLVYRDEVCIDYTPGTFIPGICVVTGGEAAFAERPASTRDLYHVPDLTRVYDGSGAVRYTRRIVSLQEPHGDANSQLTLQFLSNALHGYLPPGGVLTRDYRPGYHMPLSEDSGGAAGTQDSDLAILGGPLPLKMGVGPISHRVLPTGFYIAPLFQRAAVNRVVSTELNGEIDPDLMAERMCATGQRNSIGIAMQKILPREQGDIMLHDGV